jgi:dipeptidyl-peptidase-4
MYTYAPGTNAYSLSNDGKFAIHEFSSAEQPSVTTLISLPGHRSVKVLATNTDLLTAFQSISAAAELPVGAAEFFRVPIHIPRDSSDIGGIDRSIDTTEAPASEVDGETLLPLDAWCLYPPGFDTTKIRAYPVLFYVYGEPAAQVVRDQWSGKMGLWHRMMAQRGAVVMCVDNRGTPSLRGRAFRKSIYGKIGQVASLDQSLALQEILRSRPYLDPARVAIWGWSGGGSMSLNMLFRYPDLYSTAVSVAPVPDMRLYDTIYQERYMG